MATIIRSNGTEEKLGEVTLESLQKAVGGYIELVTLTDGCHLYVNEEGRINGLPVNNAASDLANHLNHDIVGDAVLLTPEESREQEES